MAKESFDSANAQYAIYDNLVARYRDSVRRCEDELVILAAIERQLQDIAGSNGDSSQFVAGRVDAIRAEITEYSGLGRPLRTPNLTSREYEVFGWIGEGLTTQEIAKKLSLAISTIETYRERIKFKLDLSSGNALVREAVLWAASQAPQRELRSGHE